MTSLQAPPAPDAPVQGVEIVDEPTARVHDLGDLLGAVLAALAVAAVMLVAVYAQGTAAGVAQDVRGLYAVLGRILVFPVNALVGVVALVVPVAVLTELAVRRLGRRILEVLAAAAAALGLCALLVAVIQATGSEGLVRSLSVLRGGGWVLSIPASLAALAGLLTAAGGRTRRRTVGWSWNAVWVCLGVVLVTGQVSLPGAAVALLLGRVAGLGVRYAAGVRSERAYGAALVEGIRRAGIRPVRLVRLETNEAPTASSGAAGATVATARDTDNRVYELTTDGGARLSLVVLDGDRQVHSALSRLWRSLRLRGIAGRSFVSLRDAAERAALLSYAARAAGVRTPDVLAVAEAADSMLLILEDPAAAVPLSELDPEQLTDEVLHAIWAQLRLARDAGITHRALTSGTVLVDHVGGGPRAWLVQWDYGDVASSEFARRMDVTQMLVLLAVRVGATRALASAAAVLRTKDLATVGPLLQTIALPRRTRGELGTHREVLAQLRSALVETLPAADVEPERLVRFGARTVLTLVLPVIAVVVLLASINVEEIVSALRTSDWRWSMVAFGFGLLTFLGAALTFVGFAPVTLSLRRATLVQVAAAFVALAVPAGVGPAALNLRMLTRRGVTASLALATIALVQVSQFVVTVVLLLILSLASGTNAAAQLAPSTGLLVAIGIIAGLVAASLLVPVVRQWVARKTFPTLRQTWPRLIEVMGRPGKVALAIGGNVMMTMGWLLAFYASLAAFGQHLSLVQVAVVYFVGNAAGAVIPTPGGIGTIEIALIAGLTATGINPGVAASAAILFRVLTFWLQIPIGWASYRFLRRTGEL